MSEKVIYTRFVIRNDTESNWIANNPTLLLGELGVATDKGKIKIGDNTSTWNQLEYSGMTVAEVMTLISQNRNSIYEGIRAGTSSDTSTITSIIGANVPKKGDICIIKTFISNNSESEPMYSYSSFVYDGSTWQAMDGNVNADNVIMSEDIIVAGNFSQVGNINKTLNGTTTIASTGKSIKDVLEMVLTQEIQPTITAQPTITLTITDPTNPVVGSYEVGTTILPTFFVSLSAGSYQFGPATGVTASGWSTTNSEEGSNDIKSDAGVTDGGNFPSLTIKDDTNYTITTVANHSSGSPAVTNLGNTSNPLVYIAAGTKTKTSAPITGYRKPFWGYKLDASALSNPAAITSAQVRGLGNSGSSASGLPTTLTVPAGTKQIYFAAKVNTKSSISVKNASALNAPIAFNKISSGVSVEGANAYSATAYDLWYVNFDAPMSSSAVLNITWA
jgi:hypothetical protein